MRFSCVILTLNYNNPTLNLRTWVVTVHKVLFSVLLSFSIAIANFPSEQQCPLTPILLLSLPRRRV